MHLWGKMKRNKNVCVYLLGFAKRSTEVKSEMVVIGPTGPSGWGVGGVGSSPERTVFLQLCISDLG